MTTEIPTTQLTNADFAPDGQAITTSATPLTIDPNTRAFIITSGGSGGEEFIDVPKFAVNDAGINGRMVGQRIVFYLDTQTDPSDVVKVRAQDRSFIAMYGSPNPGIQSIREAAVLDYEGALCCFVWGGDQWLIDQLIVDFNNSSRGESDPLSLTVPSASGDNDGGDITIGAGAGAGTGKGGDIAIGAGSGATHGNVKLLGLPTADPHIANALWNNSGVLTISAG